MDYADQLRNAEIFKSVDAETLAILGGGCRRRTYPAKETLFHEGDPGGTMFIVLTGRIAIQRVNDRGGIVQIASRSAGDVIGEFSLFDEAPRNADARAIEDTDVIVLQRRQVMECVQKSPVLAMNVIRSLIHKLQEATDRSASELADNVRQRISKLLVAEIRKEGEPTNGPAVSISARITHQDLANRAGCTRETVSRTLAHLRDEGVLGSTSHPIQILNYPTLQRIADSEGHY